MSRYIKIDDLEQYSLSQVVNGIINVQKLKIADVVEVVRCKYCKWHGYLTCSNPEGIKGWVTDNDFCSYGERREDDT